MEVFFKISAPSNLPLEKVKGARVFDFSCIRLR